MSQPQEPTDTPAERTAAVSVDNRLSRRWSTARRYYSAHVLQDLLGDWQLVRAWGGQGTQLGRYSITPTATQADAIALLEHEDKRRRKRGYHPSA